MTGPLSSADRANLITGQRGMEGGGREGKGKRGSSSSLLWTLTRLSIADMKY